MTRDEEKIKAQNIKYFNFWARFYDADLACFFFRQTYRQTIEAIGHIDKKSIASVGCGTGTLEVMIAEKFPDAKLIGIDLSPRMIGKAKEKSLNLLNTQFLLGESSKLPLNDSSFDIVLCVNALHHFPNQPKAIEEMRRILKNDGLLYIVDPIPVNIVEKLIAHVIKIFEPGIRFISIVELSKILKNSYFTIVGVKRLSMLVRLVRAI